MPSTTNTNNTSIVTGVPPAVHGINGNYYLDPETGQEIMITDATPAALRHDPRRAEPTPAYGPLWSLPRTSCSRCWHMKCRVSLFLPNMPMPPISTNNGIENVEQLVGRPEPDQYSADLSLFVYDAGVELLSSVQARSDVPIDLRLCAA